MLCLYTRFSPATLHEGERSRSSTISPKDSMENNEVGWVGKQGTVLYVGKEAYRVFCLSGRMLDSVFWGHHYFTLWEQKSLEGRKAFLSISRWVALKSLNLLKDATGTAYIHLNTVMNYSEVYIIPSGYGVIMFRVEDLLYAASQYLFVSYNVNCFLFTAF